MYLASCILCRMKMSKEKLWPSSIGWNMFSDITERHILNYPRKIFAFYHHYALQDIWQQKSNKQIMVHANAKCIK